MANPSCMCLVCKQPRAYKDNNIFNSKELNLRLANVVLEGRTRLLTKEDVCSPCLCRQCVAVLDKIEILELLKFQFITNFTSTPVPSGAGSCYRKGSKQQTISTAAITTTTTNYSDSPASPTGIEIAKATPSVIPLSPVHAFDDKQTNVEFKSPSASPSPTTVTEQTVNHFIPTTSPKQTESSSPANCSSPTRDSVSNTYNRLVHPETRQFIRNSGSYPSSQTTTPTNDEINPSLELQPLIVECRSLSEESSVNNNDDGLKLPLKNNFLFVRKSDVIQTSSPIKRAKTFGMVARPRQLNFWSNSNSEDKSLLKDKTLVVRSTDEIASPGKKIRSDNPDKCDTNSVLQEAIGISRTETNPIWVQNTPQGLLVRCRPAQRGRGRGRGRRRWNCLKLSKVTKLSKLSKVTIPIQPKPSTDNSLVMVNNPLVLMQPSPGFDTNEQHGLSNPVSSNQQQKSSVNIVINRGLINVGHFQMAYKVFNPDGSCVSSVLHTDPDSQQVTSGNKAPDKSVLQTTSTESTSLLQSSAKLSSSPHKTINSSNSTIGNMFLIPISLPENTSSIGTVHVSEKLPSPNNHFISQNHLTQGSVITSSSPTEICTSSESNIYTKDVVSKALGTAGQFASPLKTCVNGPSPIYTATPLSKTLATSPMNTSPVVTPALPTHPGLAVTTTTTACLPLSKSGTGSTGIAASAVTAEIASDKVITCLTPVKTCSNNTTVTTTVSISGKPHLPLSPILSTVTSNLREKLGSSLQSILKDSCAIKSNVSTTMQNGGLRQIFPKPYSIKPIPLQSRERLILPKPSVNLLPKVDLNGVQKSTFHCEKNVGDVNNKKNSCTTMLTKTSDSTTEQGLLQTNELETEIPVSVLLFNSKQTVLENEKIVTDDLVEGEELTAKKSLIVPHGIKIEKEDTSDTILSEVSAPTLEVNCSGATMVYNSNSGVLRQRIGSLTPVAVVPFHDGLMPNVFSGTLSCFLCIGSKVSASSFASVEMCEKHLKDVHSQCFVYKCALCGVTHPTSAEAKMHLTQTHSTEKKAELESSYFKREPTDYAQTQQVVSNINRPAIFSCGTCNATFSSHGECFTHIDTHTQGYMYECHMCQRLFDTSILLKSHQQSVHLIYSPK